MAPFDVNLEMIKRFTYDPDLDHEKEILQIAGQWAGKEYAPALVRAWQKTEEAILSFPVVIPMYVTFGFTWYRLWVRPLVPNIEALSRVERAYYEDFMCTMPHNPNNVDLSRDVLFVLASPEACEEDVKKMDQHLFGPMDEAIRCLDDLGERPVFAEKELDVIQDQRVRLKALRCWFMTQRSVAAWIAGVHGYLRSGEDKERYRAFLMDMMKREIENARTLQGLLDSGVTFMATTCLGETPLIHGENMKALLDKKIALMEAHQNDEPFIDPEYMQKKAAQPMS
jgi:hypothetical protein